MLGRMFRVGLKLSCDCICEICAICGQKQNRIFTAKTADNTDESQRPLVARQVLICGLRWILMFADGAANLRSRAAPSARIRRPNFVLERTLVALQV
jgi:hypothetical protein